MHATMQLKPSYLLDLSHPEFLLVLKALGGRLTPADIDAAKELGDHLTLIRAAELERTAKNLREVVGES